MIYLTFKMEQNEITKTICVQRKLVVNSCNGRCELRKSLKQFDDSEKRMQDNLKEKVELIYIVSQENDSYSIISPEINQKVIFSHFTKKPISISNYTFRPPSFFI